MVAQWLGLAAPINSGRSAVRGLAVYPEGHGMKNGATQFLSNGKRACIIPLNDKDIYWVITFPTTPMGKSPSFLTQNNLFFFFFLLCPRGMKFSLCTRTCTHILS